MVAGIVALDGVAGNLRCTGMAVDTGAVIDGFTPADQVVDDPWRCEEAVDAMFSTEVPGSTSTTSP